MNCIIDVDQLSKTYRGGHRALSDVSLQIREGEILALLGPNGAGKTTLISTICGIVNPTAGKITVGGHDIIEDYRESRSLIGLVPQELTLSMFDSVFDTVRFSRGLFGKKADDAYLEQLLKDLSLWDKRDAMIMMLSGGMKRRVLIAKALSHEPKILFLDEPTAGVDVELRKDMWSLVEKLRQRGTTIILTTHYIEEAEAIADRVGVVNKGELLVVDDKDALMHKLGKRTLSIQLTEPVTEIPAELSTWAMELSEDGSFMTYTYDPNSYETGVAELLRRIDELDDIALKDIHSKKTSLEEIFISLVRAQ